MPACPPGWRRSGRTRSGRSSPSCATCRRWIRPTYRRLALRRHVARDRRRAEACRLLLPNGPRATASPPARRCHGVDGIGGEAAPFRACRARPRPTLRAALHAYALGTRPSGIMQPVAAALDPSEIDLSPATTPASPVRRPRQARNRRRGEPGAGRRIAEAGAARAWRRRLRRLPRSGAARASALSRAWQASTPASSPTGRALDAGRARRRDAAAAWRGSWRRRSASTRASTRRSKRMWPLRAEEITAVAAWYAAQPPAQAQRGEAIAPTLPLVGCFVSAGWLRRGGGDVGETGSLVEGDLRQRPPDHLSRTGLRRLSPSSPALSRRGAASARRSPALPRAATSPVRCPNRPPKLVPWIRDAPSLDPRTAMPAFA